MIKSFLYYINNILGNIDESPFWSNFISNLLVAVPFGMLLPKWITHSKRPKRLEFYFTENGTDVLNLSKNNSESFNYNIELGLDIHLEVPLKKQCFGIYIYLNL